MCMENMGDGSVNYLPPGFRFHPTDEELILHFLYRKVARLPFYPNNIPELDLHPCDPWELHGKALRSESRWYFFSRKIEDQVVTRNGYWKQLDIVEPVFISSTGKKIGIKKYFEFYIGEAPEGVKTEWTMQEYCLLCNCDFITKHCKSRGNRKLDIEKWVLRRVQERRGSYGRDSDGEGTELSSLDEVFLSIDDDHDEISSPN